MLGLSEKLIVGGEGLTSRKSTVASWHSSAVGPESSPLCQPYFMEHPKIVIEEPPDPTPEVDKEGAGIVSLETED